MMDGKGSHIMHLLLGEGYKGKGGEASSWPDGCRCKSLSLRRHLGWAVSLRMDKDVRSPLQGVWALCLGNKDGDSQMGGWSAAWPWSQCPPF